MNDLQQANEHGAVPKKANEYKVLFLGDRLQVTASVDKAGLHKLMKILEAQEALLENGDEIS